MKPLKLLIIEDSAFNREVIRNILDPEPDIEVIGEATDGREGLKLALELQPDVITLDIEMPRMDGFTFLRILMRKKPMPVLVISSHSAKPEVFQALEFGALDFLAKPDERLNNPKELWAEVLLRKVRLVRGLRAHSVLDRKFSRAPHIVAGASSRTSQGQDKLRADKVVCFGAATGGPQALEFVFGQIKPKNNAAYLVSQQMPEAFTSAFAKRLNQGSQLTISEAKSGMPVLANHVYLAPGGRHMVVENGHLVLDEAQANADTASPIDQLFSSVAQEFAGQSIGVILTGAGRDGAQGTKAIHDAGGFCLAESEDSAIFPEMPLAAYANGGIREMLGLNALVRYIKEHL
ncbi:MAG: chemotaxis-specific protein-glutamate methyltransferase CheB [Myxococcota bacterium]|jgi:two-component system chemotaxis response regulator CheB|nr:chemotaxis-specific protein-glutamate methyltransferase CheB [Myxococcota bacterium]